MILSPSNLEDHPVGTTNPAAIINGNWDTINAAALASGSWRPFFEALAYGASLDLSLKGSRTRLLNMTGDATLTFSDIDGGYDVELIVVVDATPRDLTFPAATWINPPAPSVTLAANSVSRFLIRSTGTVVGDVFILKS